MSDDPAFVWDTSTVARPMPARSRLEPESGSGGWVTVERAAAVAGLPVEQVGSWARQEQIASRLELADSGYTRWVRLEEVLARAPQPSEQPPPPPVPRRADLPVPEGSMLVPIDAWNKMLQQLGNLHEAGQQLAEARERAAKAETEAAFLRERLAELRTRPTEVESTPEPAARAAPVLSSLLEKVPSRWRLRSRR